MAVRTQRRPAFARKLAAVAALGCCAFQASAGSCHADLLVQGINYDALSEQDKQNAATAVSEKIAAETGMAQTDVMTRVFAGNYNAPWSPSKNRPPADIFLADLVKVCQSAEMILGVFRGPQLQESIVGALKSSLANSGALSADVSIIGASVVPEKDTTPAAPAAPAVPGAPTAPAQPVSDSSDVFSQQPAAAAGGGGGAPVGLILVGLGAVLIGGVVAFPKIKKMMKKGASNDDSSDDEEKHFTGH